jgi:hypothetical protein
MGSMSWKSDYSHLDPLGPRNAGLRRNPNAGISADRALGGEVGRLLSQDLGDGLHRLHHPGWLCEGDLSGR